MHNHRRLKVWHRSMALSVRVHLLAERIPTRRAPGLKKQLTDSVQSIPTNISEGCGIGTDDDFANYLAHAIGSANESESHLLLVYGLRLIPQAECNAVLAELDEIRRMILAIHKRFKP